MTTEQTKSWGLTILVHAVLLLLLFFIYITSPIPPWEEGLAGGGGGGSFVEFGTLDIAEATPPPPPPPVPAEKVSVAEEEIITSELEETVAIPSPEKKAPEKKKPEVKPEKKPVVAEKKPPVTLPKVEVRKPDPRSLYPGRSGSGSSSGGSSNTGGTGGSGTGSGTGTGDGTGSGDGGGSGSGSGGGHGPGVGPDFDLKGRSMRSAPTVDDRSQEQGIVVIDIVVDKYGTVTSATGPGRNSTTTSSVLVRKAKEAALKTKFNPSPTGVEEQRGSITYNFLLR